MRRIYTPEQVARMADGGNEKIREWEREPIPDFDELIERSTLGSPVAKHLQDLGKQIIEKRQHVNEQPIKPCACNCGCEPDGEWHFEGIGCSCVTLQCDCVIDTPKSA
ncbi:hypothetical protein GCM10010149_88110 [Nonomuraea roseoviolacea subsp. roseoviolacea]|uniref:hypothetical protein n=1 Tax=Nonomuraea roseoviolacea TaxID=103837 RepID=UPI0031DEF571